MEVIGQLRIPAAFPPPRATDPCVYFRGLIINVCIIENLDHNKIQEEETENIYMNFLG
jgi:hypothetical protein